MRKTTLNAFLDRLGGDRPGPPRAVAASAGIATAVVVYRVLRYEEEDE